MSKSVKVKEKIIEATMNLISESNGNIEEISIRLIAEKVNIGIGLINYHFQTKEKLIEVSVDRIIRNVINAFRPEIPPTLSTPIDKLKFKVKMVFDFYVNYPAVSRISILSDMTNPLDEDNTIKGLLDCSQTADGLLIPEKQRFLLCFTLISVMQTLFLRKDSCKKLFAFDMNNKKERDKSIDLIINNLLGDYEDGKKNNDDTRRKGGKYVK